MLLTDAERARFVEYLDGTINSNKELLAQMEKMSLPAQFLSVYKQLLLAHIVVRQTLLSYEAQTLSKDLPPQHGDEVPVNPDEPKSPTWGEVFGREKVR